ncbi:putative uncharacterized protein [Acetobacter sp. CAG:977]|nr:putative uncharacterized protein [Acetobacter sp. CAG:977]
MQQVRDITAEELAKIGVNSVAYIRQRVVDNKDMWFVYAAEGTELAYTDDKNKAISLILDNELIPVSVH